MVQVSELGPVSARMDGLTTLGMKRFTRRVAVAKRLAYGSVYEPEVTTGAERVHPESGSRSVFHWRMGAVS